MKKSNAGRQRLDIVSADADACDLVFGFGDKGDPPRKSDVHRTAREEHSMKSTSRTKSRRQLDLGLNPADVTFCSFCGVAEDDALTATGFSLLRHAVPLSRRCPVAGLVGVWSVKHHQEQILARYRKKPYAPVCYSTGGKAEPQE
jgi:hypothetical protein